MGSGAPRIQVGGSWSLSTVLGLAAGVVVCGLEVTDTRGGDFNESR